MSAPPRLAATVVVLRPAGEGAPEILMVRRGRGASFMADAFVFPGGRVDDADRARGGDALAPFRVAAARELLEEASVQVDADALHPFARWVTPSAEPKRFDTCFFVVAVAAGTDARVDAAEVTEHVWAPAAALLARHERGEIKLPPPTLRTLGDLAELATLDEILAWARARPLDPIQPKLVPPPAGSNVVVTIVLPWDPRYADEPGEGTPIAADSPLAAGAPARYDFADGRFHPVK